FFFQAEDGIRDFHVTGVQTCALPISRPPRRRSPCTDATSARHRRACARATAPAHRRGRPPGGVSAPLSRAARSVHAGAGARAAWANLPVWAVSGGGPVARANIWHAEGVLTVPVRQLGERERATVERLLDQDPYGAAQVAERVATHGLSWWRADGRIFGYGSRHHVESLCWAG